MNLNEQENPMTSASAQPDKAAELRRDETADGAATFRPGRSMAELNEEEAEIEAQFEALDSKPWWRTSPSRRKAEAKASTFAKASADRRSSVSAQLGPDGLSGSAELRRDKAEKQDVPHSVFGWTPVKPWPAPVEGAELLDEIRTMLNRFVVLPDGAAEALSLWTLHTYAYHLRDVTAYVGVESPQKRCGKTTLLEVLGRLAHRPVLSSNISPPALFRVIAESRPTLLIDEADTFLGSNEEMRGILNAGYTRSTGFVVRVELSNRSAPGKLANFCCWCPKVIAAIGRLPETLADRCIVVRMQRKLPSESCERLRRQDTTVLRQMCARWVLDHEGKIAAAQPVLPECLHDRAADIWEPLLALADLAGGAWPEASRQAASRLAGADEDQSSLSLLSLDLAEVLAASKGERIFSKELVRGLNEGWPRAWADLSGGKRVTELWLARTLRPFGVRPLLIREGSEIGRGYKREDFQEMFRRYVPQSFAPVLEVEKEGESQSAI